MIPESTIQTIRQTAADDIVGLVEEHLDLKKSGQNWKGLCPFHEDKDPSLVVSEQIGIYKCFVCQAGGDALDFVIKITGMDFIEVIQELADRYHISIEEQSWDSGKQYQPPEEIIPGISGMKSRIRKHKYCILFFRAEDVNRFAELDSVPWLRLDHPISEKQAKLLAKYTENLLFRTDAKQASSEQFFESLRACMSLDLAVDILTYDTAPSPQTTQQPFSIWFNDDPSWLDFIITKQPISESLRREIVKTIAAIDNRIMRQTFKKEFFDKWEQKVTPKF